ncbi:MAG: hypothetical protein AAF721_40420 [Myxococcota bacterium]
MKVRVEHGRVLTLRSREFVAEGGEGRVWARRGIAYKVYTDGARRLAADKMAALARIQCDDVVTPQRRLLDPSTGEAIGYTMRHVPGAWVLGQLFARSFCDRHAFDAVAACALVERLRAALVAVHEAGVLVVDLSDVNVLVDPASRRPALIDTDSWQTPGHPATAVTPATRDPAAARSGFSEGSDWFALAVLAFQLWIGVHPFRGKHPTVKGLAARMNAGLSVFDPAVSVPAVCRPLDVIPGQYRAWMRSVFVDGLRDAPPSGGVTIGVTVGVTVAAPRRRARASAHALEIRSVGHAAATIRQLVATGPAAEVLLLTDAGVQRGPGGPVVGPPAAAGQPRALCVHHGGVAWVLAAVEPDRRGIALWSEACVHPTRLTIDVDAWAPTTDGRLIVRSAGHLRELSVLPISPGKVTIVVKTVGHVLPHATTLGVGVAVQDILGRAHLHLLQGPGIAVQARAPVLDGMRVLEAKYERGVLQAIARRAQSTDDLCERFVLQCSPDGTTSAWRPVGAVVDSAVDFTVTDAGVCIARSDQGLEVFAARPGGEAPTSVDAEGLGDAWLARSGAGEVLAVHDAEVLGVRWAGRAARTTTRTARRGISGPSRRSRAR